MSGIAEVAKQVGMSTATVSRALRGLPGVSESTRRKVLAAAADLQYVASPHAASLASGRSTAVAVVVPFVDRWYFGAVLRGIGDVLRPAGYDVLLYSLDGSAAERRQLFGTSLLRKRVEGVLVVSLVLEPQERETLRVFGDRVSTVGSFVPGWGSVMLDDEEAGRMATQHLLDLGHRRIALVGGSTPHEIDFTAPRLRLQGYRAALRAAGVEPDPRWEVEAAYSAASGAEAVRALLALPGPRPTGLVMASDDMAFGALQALRSTGLDVPGQMSVVGIDDHELAGVAGLSTVGQDVVEQGRIAAGHLLCVMVGAAAAGTARDVPERPAGPVLAPLSLKVRSSTAPV